MFFSFDVPAVKQPESSGEREQCMADLMLAFIGVDLISDIS